MAETESKTRRELLKYRIVCALSVALDGVSCWAVNDAYWQHRSNLSYGDSVAAKVARHHFSYFCEGGQP